MREEYTAPARVFRALSDPNRLMIVDMLSCGELCACVMLESLHITQPTLSHHMKTLCDGGLVSGRKDGKWTYYSLNDSAVQSITAFLAAVTAKKDPCICNEHHKEDCCQ